MHMVLDAIDWLAPLRLSRLTDASNSPEGQRDRIQEYADDEFPGETIVFVDVDMDVSGGMPIRQRPGFGQWLTPEKITLIRRGFLFDEADRLSRDMLDYLQYARDMAALGKIIVDVSDGTNTSTERGRQALEDRILAAQRERERIATRRRKAATRMSDAGDWGGGPPPYGWIPICKCHGEHLCPEPVVKRRKGWRLVQQPEEAPILKWMVQQRIDGKAFKAIARELNERGVVSARHGVSRKGNLQPGTWRETSVRKQLTSPRLLGQVVEMKGATGVRGTPGYKRGTVVTVRRDKDGQPIMFTDDPIIDQDTWELLQAAIKSGSNARGLPQSRHMLYRVLFCRNCSPKPLSAETGVLMYGRRWHTGRWARYAYYVCLKCGYQVHLNKAESLIEALVLHIAGPLTLLEKKVIAGNGHAADISRLERAAERRRELLRDDPGDEGLKKSLARVVSDLADLRMQPREPDKPAWKEAESGIKVAEHWENLDTAGRSQFLRDWEVAGYVDREGFELWPGLLDIYSKTFRLKDDRLVPAAQSVVIAHAAEWQRVPGAVLPALAAARLASSDQDIE